MLALAGERRQRRFLRGVVAGRRASCPYLEHLGRPCGVRTA